MTAATRLNCKRSVFDVSSCWKNFIGSFGSTYMLLFSWSSSDANDFEISRNFFFALSATSMALSGNACAFRVDSNNAPACASVLAGFTTHCSLCSNTRPVIKFILYVAVTSTPTLPMSFTAFNSHFTVATSSDPSIDISVTLVVTCLRLFSMYEQYRLYFSLPANRSAPSSYVTSGEYGAALRFVPRAALMSLINDFSVFSTAGELLHTKSSHGSLNPSTDARNSSSPAPFDARATRERARRAIIVRR
mmetsp:Transcript_6010/g.23825  ORF Transcript_6010/g.23825 Transcript_6010/m.23825 type:complete len:248 (+) Transcript_6010:1068-1811(+)